MVRRVQRLFVTRKANEKKSQGIDMPDKDLCSQCKFAIQVIVDVGLDGFWERDDEGFRPW